MSDRACVVCGAPIVEAHYANAWEKTRKVMACHSAECASRFDPDVHWMPSVAPVADAAEQRRMIERTIARINSGDKPSVVVREMLVAGVPPLELRRILIEASRAAEASESAAIKHGVARAILGIFTRKWTATENADKRDPALLRAADADITAWQARWSGS
jgi:hypothetical protein